jgi:hypothetical protein
MTQRVGSNRIANNSITTDKIASGAITADKLAAASFTTDRIADNSITTAKIQNSAVTGEKLADGSITSTKLAAGLILPNPVGNNTFYLASDGTSAVWSSQQSSITYAHATKAFNQANAAFSAANTSSDSFARSQANSSFSQANSSFSQANSSFNQANSAFVRANNSLSANVGGTISNTVIISSSNASVSISTGALQISSGGLGIAGNVHVGQDLFIGNTFSSRFFSEKANVISTGLAANNTYRLLDGVVHYHTANSSANSTSNLSGFNNIPTGNSVSMAVIVTNNASPRYITTVQIDGTQANVTIKWQGGSAPTSGATSNVDIYSFSVIKTAAPNTYTIFASKTQFG